MITEYFGTKQDYQQARLKYLQEKNKQTKHEIKKKDEDFQRKIIIQQNQKKSNFNIL